MSALSPDKRWLRHYAVLAILVGFGALLLATTLPHLTSLFRSSDGISPAVNATGSDAISITEPIALSAAPSIVLKSGRLVSGRRGATGAKSLILEEGRFEIDISASGQSSADNNAAGSDGDRLLYSARAIYGQLSSFGFDRIRVMSASARILWTGHAGIEISGLDFELVPRRTGPISANGTFRAFDEPFEFSVTFGQWSAVDLERRRFSQRSGVASRSSDIVGPVANVSLKSRAISLSFDGQLAFSEKLTAVVGDLDASVVNPVKALAAFGLAGAGDYHLEPVSISGPVIWRDGQIASNDATLRVGDQTAHGAVMFGVRENRPLVEGTLALERLDLAPYFSTLRTQSGVSGQSSAWRSADVDLTFARSIDADIRLSARQLFAAETLIGKAGATISMRGGKLNADIAELELPLVRGTMQLNADMIGASPIYSVRSRFETSDTGWLARALSVEAGIRGRTDGTADLTGTGRTLGQLLESARGKITLKATEGAVVPVTASALQMVAKLPGEAGAKEWKSVLTDAKVDEVDIRCQVEKGKIIVERASVVDKSVQTTFSGTIDRSSRVIDAKLVSIPTAVARKTPNAAKSGTEAVRTSLAVRGTLDFPRIEVLPPAQSIGAGK